MPTGSICKTFLRTKLHGHPSNRYGAAGSQDHRAEGVRRRAWFFLRKLQRGASLPNRSSRASSSCRTTIRVRRKACCAACIIRSSMRRASWCVWSKARCSTWPSTSARARRISASGWACTLSVENHRQLWVPPGFAHGFVVLSESAQFLYKTTDYWFPEHERSIVWNDPGDRDRVADRLRAAACREGCGGQAARRC